VRLLILLLLAVVAVGATAFARGDTPYVADLAVVNEFAVGKEVAVVKEFTAALSGEEAVPGPGDQNGSGTVNLRVNRNKQKVCQVMRLKGVPDSSVANIRRGRRGKTGPIVVDLDLFGRVTRSCTTSVPGNDLRAMVRHPGRFYVNVTSDSHPRSAVRGQLQRVDHGGTTTTTGPPGG
jgi:hypothetical protein